MTPEKLISLFTKYQEVCPPKQLPFEYYDKCISEIPYRLEGKSLELGHISWMCKVGIEWAREEGKFEQAICWLGFVQGVLWKCGYKTLDQVITDECSD